MDSTLSPTWIRQLQQRLLAWFENHARDLPWRRTDDPYRIWVSEIMLQQTQVATVIPYFERFVSRFPDVGRLAEADEQQVLREWEGLGYYRRARQLHAAAKQIVEQHDGVFPEDYAAVLALPGIGRYTAGAILSIARDQRLPILEANTVRLYSRLMGETDEPTRSATQRRLWSFAEDILPENQVGHFNQALMELGSKVCTPRTPNCQDCPVAQLCEAFRTGRQSEIPAAKPKMRYEERTEAAVILRRRGRVLLRQCGPDERWAGLWDFPRFVVSQSDGPDLFVEIRSKVNELTGLSIDPGARLTTIKHGVTRYRITLFCHEATIVAGRLRSSETLRWQPIGGLRDMPLSVTGRQISQLLAS